MKRAQSAACLVLSSALAGCTAISWRDSAGNEHHVGLVAAREDTIGGTSVLRRYSLGADARLSGEDAGWTLGVHASRAVRPDATRIAPELLAKDVAAFLASPHSPPVVTTWRFLWFTDERPRDVALIETESFGLQIGAARSGRGLFAGYTSVRAVVGAGLEDEVVLLLGTTNGIDDAHLWRLSSPRAPLVEAGVDGEERRE